MRACIVVLALAALGCHRDDPAKIEKTNDPAPPPTTTKKKSKATPAKGGCVDETYDDTLKVGATATAAFSQESSPPPVGLGSMGTPPPASPYLLHAFVVDAPDGADATAAVRALCDDHPKIRACFDAVRDRLAFGEFVDAQVSVDAKGRLDAVKGVRDEGLRSCLLDAVAAADLPKPNDAGVWSLRFEVYAGTSSGDGSALASAVRKITPLVRRCYETALASNPTLAGKLMVHLVVDATGSVKSATSTPATTITDAAFVSCALTKLRAARFPPGETDREINVPFSFVAK